MTGLDHLFQRKKGKFLARPGEVIGGQLLLFLRRALFLENSLCGMQLQAPEEGVCPAACKEERPAGEGFPRWGPGRFASRLGLAGVVFSFPFLANRLTVFILFQ